MKLSAKADELQDTVYVNVIQSDLVHTATLTKAQALIQYSNHEVNTLINDQDNLTTIILTAHT